MSEFSTLAYYVDKYAKFCIKYQTTVYPDFLGTCKVRWDSHFNRLSILLRPEYFYFLWLVEQVLGSIIYGVIFTLLCFSFKINASVFNYVIMVMIMSASIAQLGLEIQLCATRKTISTGVNFLLDKQQMLLERK